MQRRDAKTGIPRSVEAALALLGLLTASPVLVLVATAVFIGSGRPILFRQRRIGKHGKPFTLFKFRSMSVMSVSNAGPGFTAAGDNRITAVGRLLRRSKIDELPELWNILKGDMSFVGPRPEVPQYVDCSQPAWQFVLQARPGLTDPVTIDLRHEESLLESVQGDREQFYISVLVPLKLEGYREYLARRTFWSDVSVLVRTAFVLVSARRVNSFADDLKFQSMSEHSDHSFRK